MHGTLAGWRKQRGSDSNKEKEAENNPDDEIARLKKEVNALQKTNSILKDALVFFVEDRKR